MKAPKVARATVLVMLLARASSMAQEQPAQPLVHFHHVHLNALNPELAMGWYTRHFDCERAKFGGTDALWAGKSWILFNKVDQPPLWKITTALYHIGWGAENAKADYEKFIAMGARFETHMRDLAEGLPLAPGLRYYMYLWGPDNVMIEDITANHHYYDHVHLLSEDPVSAGEWYQKEFGFPRRAQPPSRQPRFFNGYQIGPTSGFNIDNVNVPIFPIELARELFPAEWEGRKHPDSPKGHALDHFAFSCENLEVMLARLRKDGVKVVEEPRVMLDGALKSAFIEGPDSVPIELVEGHAKKE
ncbi:MAG: VOC family protein [Acidobacteriia bacterium]|nr:VOC family protein [Terriglobia bacterium]